MTRITQQQLESYLWGAAVLLRGTIDAGDYKQFIFPLLFYKRLCDVFEEETVTALRESGGDEDFALFPENHRFQIPADAHWREIRKVSRDVGRGLQQAMRAIETANPDKLFGIFGDAQWTNKDRLSDAMLRDLIEHFSTLELTIARLPEDELGQGYEYLSPKQGNREAFAADPWGRNVFGVPPPGRADYAFQQYILSSLKPKTGRCAVLWPHGVLFRQEEAEMRRKLIEADLIECVLGLGPNLFYNSPMEACVVVCRTQKPKARRGKILFINAVNEVTRERAQSFLTGEHLQRVVRAYQDFKDEPGFTRVVPIEEIRAKEGSLNITLYVGGETQAQTDAATEIATTALPVALASWLESSSFVRSALSTVLQPGTSR